MMNNYIIVFMVLQHLLTTTVTTTKQQHQVLLVLEMVERNKDRTAEGKYFLLPLFSRVVRHPISQVL